MPSKRQLGTEHKQPTGCSVATEPFSQLQCRTESQSVGHRSGGNLELIELIVTAVCLALE